MSKMIPGKQMQKNRNQLGLNATSANRATPTRTINRTDFVRSASSCRAFNEQRNSESASTMGSTRKANAHRRTYDRFALDNELGSPIETAFQPDSMWSCT